MVPDSDIDSAVAILRRGGLVAFPTETVYGLGADAGNPNAIKKLYFVKGRPRDHPVIVHIADIAQLPQWASAVTLVGQQLAREFWPGPLTLILQCAHGVSHAVTGGQGTVGLRIPSHPVAHKLLKKFGGGIAAPSANRFGYVSATTAQHVKHEFGATIDLVLDGGQSEVGIESTIIDVTGERPVLLRPGHISAHEIERVIGVPLAPPRADSPRAPGMLAAHYAPRTPLMVLPGAALIELAASLVTQGKRIAVLAHTARQPARTLLAWIGAPCEARDFAHALYANLRELDARGCDLMLVEQPPPLPEWAAIIERLGHAVAGSRQS